MESIVVHSYDVVHHAIVDAKYSKYILYLYLLPLFPIVYIVKKLFKLCIILLADAALTFTLPTAYHRYRSISYVTMWFYLILYYMNIRSCGFCFSDLPFHLQFYQLSRWPVPS